MIGFNKLLRLLEELQRRLSDMEIQLAIMQELNGRLEDRLKALEAKRHGNRQRPVIGGD